MLTAIPALPLAGSPARGSGGDRVQVPGRPGEAPAGGPYLVDGIDWGSIDYLTKVFGLEGQSYGDAEMVRQLRTQFALAGAA